MEFRNLKKQMFLIKQVGLKGYCCSDHSCPSMPLPAGIYHPSQQGFASPPTRNSLGVFLWMKAERARVGKSSKAEKKGIFWLFFQLVTHRPVESVDPGGFSQEIEGKRNISRNNDPFPPRFPVLPQCWGQCSAQSHSFPLLWNRKHWMWIIIYFIIFILFYFGFYFVL